MIPESQGDRIILVDAFDHVMVGDRYRFDLEVCVVEQHAYL